MHQTPADALHVMLGSMYYFLLPINSMIIRLLISWVLPQLRTVTDMSIVTPYHNGLPAWVGAESKALFPEAPGHFVPFER